MQNVEVRHHFRLGFNLTQRQLLKLLRNPLFIFITLLGNSLVLLASAALYYFERDLNPQMVTFFDAFYLAMTTITTVGFGDIYPVSTAGRIVTMLLMVSGTGLFLTYIAMLSSHFSSAEMAEIEAELKRIESELKRKK